MPELAVVSMVKKRTNRHVFLVIETVEDNHCIIRQADFFLDQKQSSLQLGLFAKGAALIEMVKKSEFDMKQLLSGCSLDISYPLNTEDFKTVLEAWKKDKQAKKEEGVLLIYSPADKLWKAYLYYQHKVEQKDIQPATALGKTLAELTPHILALYDKTRLYDLLASESLFADYVFSSNAGCQLKSWGIEARRARQLIDSITADQAKRKQYANALNQAFNADSCLTWCEEKLTEIGIDVSKQQSWLDVVVALPSVHMEKEKSTSRFSFLKNKTKSTDTDTSSKSNNNNEPNTKNQECLIM